MSHVLQLDVLFLVAGDLMVARRTGRRRRIDINALHGHKGTQFC